MTVIDISEFEDSVVLHFETEGHKINAYTLASTLVSIADAAKAANRSCNPGYEIEVLVESLGQGSFRAKVKAVYSSSRNLFSSELVRGIVIGIVCNYIYERTLSIDDGVDVSIHTNEVIITKGEEKIVVPRQVYDATREAERDPQFVSSIAKTLDSISSDSQVSSFGFVQDMDSPPPELLITKAVISQIELDVVDDPDDRIIEENCSLQIIKAILERSKRKWEFMWRGIKISAPIVAESFYTEFFAHEITIAPGDELEVQLRIKQKKDPRTGIYANKSYEVSSVFKHVPRPRQSSLPETNQ